MWDCKGCKNSCCKHKKPALNKADVVRLYKKLGKDVFKHLIFRPDIQGRVVKGSENEGVLTLKSKEDGSCVFYDGELCTVYKYRPTSCKLYPYNPIFTQHDGYYTMCETTSECKELDKGHSFNHKNTALQWRRERLEYDKIVFDYNNKENRDFREFLVGLIK